MESNEPSVSFSDPLVQKIYDILCDDEDYPSKKVPQQHWEGWMARRIVETLLATDSEYVLVHRNTI